MPPEMLLQGLHQQLPGENHSIPIMSPAADAAAAAAAAAAATDVTVLERQMAFLQWRQRQRQQQQQTYFADAPNITEDAPNITADTFLVASAPYSLPQVAPHVLQACGEQGMIGAAGPAGAWPDLTHYSFICNSGPREDVVVVGGGGGGGAITRSAFGFPPLVMINDVDESRGGLSTPPESDRLEHVSAAKQGGAAATAASGGGGTLFSRDGARESSKKRKSTERSNTTHELIEDDHDGARKTIKVENTETPPAEPKVESPASTVITAAAAAAANYYSCKGGNNNNRDSSSGASTREQKKKKAPEAPAPKTDFIHVRARRGQATDSHSLAERVRREKISERMKLLQGLVPGCNKITGKAGMLDEIINYVQSLQRQVEFLSMKLAAVTPAPLEFNLDAFIAKEMSALGCGVAPPQMGLIPELLGLSFVPQFNPLQQQAMASAAAAAAAAAAECCGLPASMVISSCSGANSSQEALRAVAGAVPAAAPDRCSFPESRDTPSHPRTTQLTASAAWEGELQSFYASTMAEGFEQGSRTPASSLAVDSPVAPPSSTFQA